MSGQLYTVTPEQLTGLNFTQVQDNNTPVANLYLATFVINFTIPANTTSGETTIGLSPTIPFNKFITCVPVIAASSASFPNLTAGASAASSTAPTNIKLVWSIDANPSDQNCTVNLTVFSK